MENEKNEQFVREIHVEYRMLLITLQRYLKKGEWELVKFTESISVWRSKYVFVSITYRDRTQFIWNLRTSKTKFHYQSRFLGIRYNVFPLNGSTCRSRLEACVRILSLNNVQFMTFEQHLKKRKFCLKLK